MSFLKKMIRIFLLIAIVSLTSACNNVKDGLSLKKKSNTDEFLVKKKNPLVLPPEFDELPTPNESDEEEEDAGGEIEKLLSKNKNKVVKSQTENNSSEIEKNILKKIKTK